MYPTFLYVPLTLESVASLINEGSCEVMTYSMANNQWLGFPERSLNFSVSQEDIQRQLLKKIHHWVFDKDAIPPSGRSPAVQAIKRWRIERKFEYPDELRAAVIQLTKPAIEQAGEELESMTLAWQLACARLQALELIEKWSHPLWWQHAKYRSFVALAGYPAAYLGTLGHCQPVRSPKTWQPFFPKEVHPDIETNLFFSDHFATDIVLGLLSKPWPTLVLSMLFIGVPAPWVNWRLVRFCDDLGYASMNFQDLVEQLEPKRRKRTLALLQGQLVEPTNKAKLPSNQLRRMIYSPWLSQNEVNKLKGCSQEHVEHYQITLSMSEESKLKKV